MLNILIGAGIGALVNVGAYCAIQLWKGQPIQMKAVGAAIVGGAVAGALAGTTFGVSLLAGSATSAAGFLALDGGAAAGAEKIASNAFDHKALGDGVPEAAAWGAITAPATGLALRGLGSQFSQLVSEANATATTAATAASTDASTTAATAVTAATDGAAADGATTAATTATASASRLPLINHFHAPTAHVLGLAIANSMFGSPWVGEAVSQYQGASTPTPVDPHNGLPLPSTTPSPAATTPASTTSSTPASTASSSGSTTTSSTTGSSSSTTASTTTAPAAPVRPLPLPILPFPHTGPITVTPVPFHAVPGTGTPAPVFHPPVRTTGVTGTLGAPAIGGHDE